MRNITCEIKNEIAILSTNKNGWRLELNEVSWNGQKTKLDLRHWAPNHERQGKGVTLTREEAAALCKALILEGAND